MNFKKTQLLSDINSAIINTHDCNIFYRKLYFILDDEVENYISSDLYNEFKTEHQILASLLYSNNNTDISNTIQKLQCIVTKINEIIMNN
jgi:hypothetical protein